MTAFIFLFLICYAVIGISFMPMFTRASFKALSEKYGNQNLAKQHCGMHGMSKSLIWPVALPMHFSVNAVVRELDAEKKKEQERAEVQRILKEYEDNDPVNIEFKRLEAEEQNVRLAENIRKIKASVDKMPKELTFAKGGYEPQNQITFSDEEYEIRSFNGNILYTNKKINPQAELENITTEMESIRTQIEDLRSKHESGLISYKSYTDNVFRCTKKIQNLNKEAKKIYDQIKY